MALFGEKYGSEVRVVSFGDASIELCGGTHVSNTANIGSFFILKESGVSAGVRRIEAICGGAALVYAQNLRAEIEAIKESVKHKEPLIGINRLKEEIKTLKMEVESLNANAGKSVESLHVNGVELIVDVLGAGDIKARIDDLKNEKDSVAVLLLQVKEDKVMIAAGVKNASIKAGAWIKEIAPIVGGGGGGRDDFAQAGGRDASKIEEAKKAAIEYAKTVLQG
jgi:alanyl-tRNA synthetase